MNHKFLPSQLNVLTCATCKRSMVLHLPTAQCEACGRVDSENDSSKLELINDILLCRNCLSNELESITDRSLQTINDNDAITNDDSAPKGIDIPILESEKFYTTARSIAVDLPANGSEFYNSKIISIMALEAKINADDSIENKPYFFAQQIQARQAHLYKTLVSVRELITEIDSERHANFRAINALASRLKSEERAKLNIKYAEYVAPSKVSTVRQPRMKTEDKVIEGIAKMMFAPRKDGIIQWDILEKSERESLIQKAKQYFKGSLK